MKVIEKDTDRKAEVHLGAKGGDKALDKYGEGFDQDGALACYVPVELGQRIRVTGKYLGTTRVVQTDIYIDGVCRRSRNTSGKTPKHRSEKLDCMDWLVKTEGGVVETECEVTALPEERTHAGSEDVETCPHVGTIEVHLYVLRHKDEEHSLQSPEQTSFYFDEEEDDYMAPEEGSAIIPTQTYLKFEKNSTVIDTKQANRYLRYARSMRPGKQEWAVFRFHYRTKESILEKNLRLTFVDKDKSFIRNPAHELRIEPVALEGVANSIKVDRQDDDKDSAFQTSSAHCTVPPESTSPVTATAAAEKDGRLLPMDVAQEGPLTTSRGIPKHLESPTIAASIIVNGITSTPVDSKRPRLPSRSSSPLSKRAKPASPPVILATATNDDSSEATSIHHPKSAMSIERQLTEARRRKARAAEERKDLAAKQAAVDKQLEPYQARMKVELERVQKEAQEIEMLRREEEQRFNDSFALLKGFQGTSFR